MGLWRELTFAVLLQGGLAGEGGRDDDDFVRLRSAALQSGSSAGGRHATTESSSANVQRRNRLHRGPVST